MSKADEPIILSTTDREINLKQITELLGKSEEIRLPKATKIKMKQEYYNRLAINFKRNTLVDVTVKSDLNDFYKIPIEIDDEIENNYEVIYE